MINDYGPNDKAILGGKRRSAKIVERWRDIIGYTGLYEISDHGRVRSGKAGVWKFLKPLGDGKEDSYLHVRLYDRDRNWKQARIHILVAEHFIPNPDCLPVVDHIKEGDKQNNHYTNLRWTTQKDNMVKALAKYWIIETPEGVSLKVYNLKDFCIEHDLSQGNMSQVAAGKRNHHKGFQVQLFDNDKNPDN